MDISVIKKSIVRITSRNSDNQAFGTGFVIAKHESFFYVLTCAHIVYDVGGSGNIEIDQIPAILIASGLPLGIDLAVLQVENLHDALPIPLKVCGERDMSFLVIGFTDFNQKEHQFAVRSLRGTLGDQIMIEKKGSRNRVPVWDLKIDDDFSVLKQGYSGAPVINPATNMAFAVASVVFQIKWALDF